MDNHKIVPIIKHCKHVRKLNNCFTHGHWSWSLFYISNINRAIYKKAYSHRYDKFKKAPFKTHLSLYSRYPIYDMIDICSTEPTDSDIEYFERSMS